jgi:hypothetical protein
MNGFCGYIQVETPWLPMEWYHSDSVIGQTKPLTCNMVSASMMEMESKWRTNEQTVHAPFSQKLGIFKFCEALITTELSG